MIKVCEICGREFERTANNEKYCSYCKKIAAKLTRIKWEKQTGYKEKKNRKQNEQRAAARSRRAQEQAQAQEQAAAAKALDQEQRAAEFEQARRADLEQKAADGDQWAAAQLAIMNKDIFTYWAIRSEMERAEAERTGNYYNNTVGGISLYETDFAQKVMYEILKDSPQEP